MSGRSAETAPGKIRDSAAALRSLSSSDGQIEYPVSPDPKAPWVPEIYGNAMLANGKLFPYLEVEPRKYRFRVMNGSNARFFRLSMGNC